MFFKGRGIQHTAKLGQVGLQDSILRSTIATQVGILKQAGGDLAMIWFFGSVWEVAWRRWGATIGERGRRRTLAVGLAV